MKRPLTLGTLAALALALALARGADAQAPTQSSDGASVYFAVKASPQSAPAVTRALAELAEPRQVTLAPGETTNAAVARACGPAVPATFTVIGGPPAAVRFAPCLRSQAEVRTKVVPNTTLEAIAVRLGLGPTQKSLLLATVGPRSKRSGPVRPDRLMPGDIVIARNVPQWTPFTPRPEVGASRAAVVARFASALDCGASDPERCLTQKDVYVRREEVVPRAPAQPYPPTPQPMPALSVPATAPPPPTITSTGPASKPPWWLRVWPFPPGLGVRAGAVGEAVAFTALQYGAPVPPPPPETALPKLSVAPEQWPYEARMVAQLLAEFVKLKGSLTPSIVGVADTGLGSWVGGPLPDKIFSEVEERAVNEPDGIDQNGNEIVDDLVGAGAPRAPGQTEDIGDVRLCPDDARALIASTEEDVGHGAVVASLASGYRLRKQHPEVAEQLPKILFYRLVGRQCGTADGSDVRDAQLAASLRYLLSKSTVYSLSWMGSTTRAEDFTSALIKEKPYSQKLVLIAAGNTPRDLDAPNPDCPACLGTPYGADTRDRVVLIGAATPTLVREVHSGFGRLSVQLYAPADGAGALDLAGRERTDLTPATSYATPYAAFAAALLASIGAKLNYHTAAELRGRLMLATWALANDAKTPEARIVDLTKVAAVLHNAVEVQEGDPGGGTVLRTYVGDVTGGLSDICQNSKINQQRYQAIRMGPPDPAGFRDIALYGRNLDPVSHALQPEPDRCRPIGALTLKTLDGETKTFPLSQVSQVLLRWKASNN